MIKSTKVFIPPEPGAGRHYDGYRRMMAGIMKHAYVDFWNGKNLAQNLDALYFLAGDAEAYCEVLGISADPLQPIVDGKKVKSNGRVLHDI